MSLAILIAGLTLGVAGALLFWATKDIARLPQHLYEKPYTIGLALRDIRADLLMVHHALEAVAVQTSHLRLRRFDTDSSFADRRIETQVRQLRLRFSEEDALNRQFEDVYEAWLLIRADVVQSARAGDGVRAYTLVKTEGVTLLTDMLDLLDTLLFKADAYATAAKERNDQVKARTLGGVLIGLMIGFSGLLLLSIFLRRSVILPTVEISMTIRKIAKGDLGHLIPHCDRQDEVGEIARSAEVFRKHAVAVKNSQIDLLTGMPSRGQLHDHLKMLHLDADNKELAAALIHFDLDRFGETNDSFGRGAGDALLTHAARVIRENSRIGDFIARDSGDSFVMLVVGMADLDDVARLAGEICAGVSLGIQFEGQAVRTTCSAGVAVCDRGSSVDSMLAHAESAVVEARKLGPGSIEIYTQEMDQRLRRRRETLMGLKFAFKNDEIVPFFQPQICAISGKLTGFEALVRWNHPEHGVLSPWQFIDVAAGAGLLSSLTDMMIAKSLEQLARWRRMGFDVPRMSLNFAASDLGRAGFVDFLSLEVERTGLDPNDICVELLESTMIEDSENPVSRALDRLGELGFPIELDDFGTGHAAISTLHLVKLSGIKIDRSFITKMDKHVDQQHLTRGILRISRALQISTVAEGVESEAERELLVGLGCDTLQGFWISPPMSGPDASLWIEEYAPRECRMPLAEPA